MRFALATLSFDAMTIVDSDQLALLPGYSRRLAQCLDDAPGIGLLGNAPGLQGPDTTVAAAVTAFREIDLWRPLLRRFHDGESKFVHWSSWPATIFTVSAARDLVALFDRDRVLQTIMEKSEILATEEVILPTLVALLGYTISLGPFSYDFLNYRVRYSTKQIARAMYRSDVYWVHPVARRHGDRVRRLIRARYGDYRMPAANASFGS
jgi:hypothetical protein